MGRKTGLTTFSASFAIQGLALLTTLMFGCRRLMVLTFPRAALFVVIGCSPPPFAATRGFALLTQIFSCIFADCKLL